MGEVPHGSHYAWRGRYGLAICHPVHKSRCKQMQILNAGHVNANKKLRLRRSFLSWLPLNPKPQSSLQTL